MDKFKLIVIRGKLEAIERGLTSGLFSPTEAIEEAQQLLTDYPDMPEEEKARINVFLGAGNGNILAN